MNLLHIALKYHHEHLNVLPLAAASKAYKKTWKHWQKRHQAEQDIHDLFDEHEGNIAIICGAVSGNLVVLDIDDAARYEATKTQFVSHYGETLCVRTARGGHIYFRTSVTLVSTQPEGFEVRSEGSYVVAPPSLCLDGLRRYEQDSNTTNIIEIQDWQDFPICPLTPCPNVQDAPPAPEQKAARPHQSSLGQNKVVSRCYDKQQHGRYKSLSEFDQCIIQSLVNGGASLDEVKQALLLTSHPTHYRRLAKEKGQKEADANLKRSYLKAKQLGDSSEVQQLLKRLDYIEQWAKNDATWQSRSGLNNRSVFLAHVHQCRKAKREPWFLSCRDGAPLAVVTPMTFSRRTRKLIEENLLSRHNRNQSLDANSYSFGIFFDDGFFQNVTPPHEEVSPIVCNALENTLSSATLTQSRELSKQHPQTLGKSPVYIWEWLYKHRDKEPRKWRVAEVARETGRSYNTTRRALDKLLKEGWIAQEGRFYFARDDAEVYVFTTHDASQVSDLIRQDQHRYERERDGFRLGQQEKAHRRSQSSSLEDSTPKD